MKAKLLVASTVLATMLPTAMVLAASEKSSSASNVNVEFTIKTTVRTQTSGDIALGEIGWGSGTNNPDVNNDVQFTQIGTSWKWTASPALDTKGTVGKLTYRANVPVTIDFSDTGFEKKVVTADGTSWNKMTGATATPEDQDTAYYLGKFLKYDIAFEGLYWGHNLTPESRVFSVAKDVKVGQVNKAWNISSSNLGSKTGAPNFAERDTRGGTYYIVPRFSVPTDSSWDTAKWDADANQNWKGTYGGSSDRGSFDYGFIGADAGTYRDVFTLTVAEM